MGLKLTDFFEPNSYEDKDTEVIVCNECLAHLCLSSLVLSDQFWGLSGEAYLVDRLINIVCDKKDLETSMRTGVYVINKIKCLQCSTKLGWHYKKSFKYSEYYKEGKYVIEKKFIRQITNHCSMARLAEHAKLLKRRRSSASIASSQGDDDQSIKSFRAKIEADEQDLVGVIPVKNGPRRSSVLGFRDGISQLLARNRNHTEEKIEIDEEDESAGAFVDPWTQYILFVF